MSTTTDSLFKDLQDAIVQEDFDKVQELCDKLWVKYPGDVDVAKVRAVALLQQGNFEKALTFIKSCNASLQDLLKEEKAYCLYRTRNYDEVISILSQTPDNPFKDNLLAQTYYRLGKYQEAFLIFRKLSEQRPDDLELKTNLLATLASSASSPEVSEAFRGVRSANAEAIESNYELSYNVACALLRLGSVKEAESALKHALDVCQQQNSSEDSFLEESSAIRAQLAYTLQISDPSASDEPTSTYLSILSNKSADKSVVAVASNNLVVLQKEQKLFGAEKKLTTALEVAQEGRLTQEQKSILTFNKAILLLKMNRLEQVQELLASFRAEFPDSHLPTLVASALLFREKKELEAISLLKDNLHSFREGLVPFLLILAHLSSDKKEKLGYLMAAPADFKFRAGTTAATISLLEQIGDPAAATQHLDQAIAFWKKSKGAQELEIYKQLLLANASLKMDSQQFEDAALIFKELQRIDGERGKEYLCKEILAYARFDPSKAADLSRQLPEISVSSSSSSFIDVEALENLSLSRPSKPVEAKVEVTTSAQDNAQKKAKNKKKKNKKNKKKRLPKKYDPNSLPDPERWLPLRSRSTFKNRGKKASTRSHQGAVSTGQEKIAPTGTSHKQSSSSSSSSSRSRGGRRGRR